LSHIRLRGPSVLDANRRPLRWKMLYLSLSRTTPPNSHSIIFSHGNGLIFWHNFFCARSKTCTRSVRNWRSWFQIRISASRHFLGFSDYRHRSVDFFETPKKSARSAMRKNTVNINGCPSTESRLSIRRYAVQGRAPTRREDKRRE